MRVFLGLDGSHGHPIYFGEVFGGKAGGVWNHPSPWQDGSVTAGA